MSTRNGFPRMDWDTGFLADPKFQHLRDLLPDPIQFGYAGFCFLRLTADAWRTCSRHAITAVVRGIEPWAAEALDGAGLTDGGVLTQESYDKWVGAALHSRQAQADKQARHRQSPSVTVTNGQSPSVTKSLGQVGLVGQVGTVGPEDAVFVFLAQHGAAIRPDAPLGRRLYGLMDRRTPEVVLREAEEMAKVEPVMSDRQWVLGLENGLEAIPSGKKSVDAAVAEEAEARSAAIGERMHARRLDYLRNTGLWPEEWGERPSA